MLCISLGVGDSSRTFAATSTESSVKTHKRQERRRRAQWGHHISRARNGGLYIHEPVPTAAIRDSRYRREHQQTTRQVQGLSEIEESEKHGKDCRERTRPTLRVDDN